MITNIQTNVTFSDGKTYPVDNFTVGFGDLVEFDAEDKHYCVRLERNSNFATFVGTWDEEELCYKYTRQFDLTVVKISRTETFMDDFACI